MASRLRPMTSSPCNGGSSILSLQFGSVLPNVFQGDLQAPKSFPRDQIPNYIKSNALIIVGNVENSLAPAASDSALNLLY